MGALLGGIVALWICSVGTRARRLLQILAVVNLCLAPFLVVNAWIDWFGANGRWSDRLPFELYSQPAVALLLAMLFWPVATLLVHRELQATERGLHEAESGLAGVAFVRHLLWPRARTAFYQSLLLIGVLALSQFSIPAILQVKVYPAELWVRFNTTFDHREALWLSWPFLVLPCLMLLMFWKRPIRWPAVDNRLDARRFRRQLGGPVLGVVVAISALTFALAPGLPLTQLLFSASTWADLPSAAAAGIQPGLQTFAGAVLAATGATAVGWLLSSWRWPVVTWPFFLLPGVVIGILFIHLFNRPETRWIYDTPLVVWLGLVLRYTAPAWFGARLLRRGMDRELDDMTRVLGAGGAVRFLRVELPMLGGRLFAVWYVLYLLCLWDVETPVLIVPPGGETLSLRVFNLLHYGHNTQVNALCLMLLGIAVLPLGLAWLIRGIVRRNARRLALSAALGAGLLAGCSDNDPLGAGLSPLDGGFFDRVRVIGSRGAGPGEFNKPRSVAVDADDNIYVVDLTGRVQKFSPDGEYLFSWQMPRTGRGLPKGMSVDRDGNIVVVEPHYTRVNHFRPDGELVLEWGEEGREPGRLIFPRSVAVTSEGEMWISEYSFAERIQRFSPDGSRFLDSIGSFGHDPGELNRAEGICVDASDTLYVADSCNHRVQVFSADGEFLRAYGRSGTGPGEMSYPYDIRVDAEGRQFVCEFGNSRIQVFNQHDEVVEIIGGSGRDPGEFNNPWSIALDSRGNLIVADSLNHRVQKLYRRRALAGRVSTEVPGP